MLVTPQLLKKLDNLSLITRKFFSGKLRGERKSPKKGAGVEFTDFRNYTIGDDFRYVDWNTYARCENLFLKLFVEEEDLAVYLLLDGSLSMDFGSPNKFEFAKSLACAFSYIALSNIDRVSISFLSNKRYAYLPLKHGKNQFSNIVEFLESQSCQGEFLIDSVNEFLSNTRKKGFIIFFSDFLWNDGFETPLKKLKSSNFEVAIIQTLSPQEINPREFVGDWKLVDVENGEKVEVSVGPAVIKSYKNRLQIFLDSIKRFSVSNEINYLLVNTETDLEKFFTVDLRKTAFVE